MQICKEYRTENNVPCVGDSVQLVFALKFALKKCDWKFCTWQEAIKKIRCDCEGEDTFLALCKEAKLHIKADNDAKIELVKAVQKAVKAPPTTTKENATKSVRQSRQPPKKPVHNATTNVHRSVQKNMLMPYISSLYHLNILNPEEYSPELLLSDKVMDHMAATCHRHFTSFEVGRKTHYFGMTIKIALLR